MALSNNSHKHIINVTGRLQDQHPHSGGPPCVFFGQGHADKDGRCGGRPDVRDGGWTPLFVSVSARHENTMSL